MPLVFSFYPGWRPIPAVPVWTSITNRQPKTWLALRWGARPPPFRWPTFPLLARGARDPNIFWSSKASRTTIILWRAPCEGLLQQEKCVSINITWKQKGLHAPLKITSKKISDFWFVYFGWNQLLSIFFYWQRQYLKSHFIYINIFSWLIWT